MSGRPGAAHRPAVRDLSTESVAGQGDAGGAGILIYAVWMCETRRARCRPRGLDVVMPTSTPTPTPGDAK
ncbi:hypothetical protein WS89_21030 [Burkholderia sp. MSMB1072]|nr:hypothetical protein WS89_21030 [Burkholderia sp. MSMB1072]